MKRSELRRTTPLERKSPLSRSGMKPARKPMSRSQPRRNWADARRKVEAEGLCRVCGTPFNLEAAHVWGREADEPTLDSGSVLWVKPDRIVPLCRGDLGTFGCHESYDRHELDLLPHLSPAEQSQLVKDAGGIVTAYKRATGQYPHETERRAA